jgi:hypothetical protein
MKNEIGCLVVDTGSKNAMMKGVVTKYGEKKANNRFFLVFFSPLFSRGS